MCVGPVNQLCSVLPAPLLLLSRFTLVVAFGGVFLFLFCPLLRSDFSSQLQAKPTLTTTLKKCTHKHKHTHTQTHKFRPAGLSLTDSSSAAPNRLCTDGSGEGLYVGGVCELVTTKRQKDFYNNSTKSQCKPSR